MAGDQPPGVRERVRMDWRDVLFASWPVEPAALDARLPAGLSPDTHDGSAWLSVVAFEMADVRPAGVPAALGQTFPEVNLRTYVTGPGGPGIYFYSLDAADLLGVALARAVYRLPYHYARMERRRAGGRTRFASERRHPGAPSLRFEAEYAPAGGPGAERGGDPAPEAGAQARTPDTGEQARGPDATPADEGTLDRFLAERYRFYVGTRRGLRRCEVDHEPWPVAPAEATLSRNDLFAANGFPEPDGEAHLRHSAGVSVVAGPPVEP